MLHVCCGSKKSIGFKLFSLKESLNEWFSHWIIFNYSMSTRVCHRASCKHLRHEMGCPTWPSFTCATWWLTRTTQLNKGGKKEIEKIWPDLSVNTYVYIEYIYIYVCVCMGFTNRKYIQHYTMFWGESSIWFLTGHVYHSSAPARATKMKGESGQGSFLVSNLPPRKTIMTMENHKFNRRYIFIQGCLSVVMSVFRGVTG